MSKNPQSRNGEENEKVIGNPQAAQLVERRSLTGELSLSCARPAADE